MSDAAAADTGKPAKPTPLGIYDKPVPAALGMIELVATLLSVLWLVMSVVFFLFDDGSGSGAGQQFLMTVFVIFLPVAMIWVAATTARSAMVMREESARLQAAIDAIRHSYIAHAQGAEVVSDNSVTRKLDEIAASARKTETALATFYSSRPDAPQAPPPAPEMGGDAQPSLQLDVQEEEDPVEPLEAHDLIRALNFPETAEDEDGFTALRKAMRNREVALLVTAAQDVLTLLSQDGIYMDDLNPERARPDIWRQFAAGDRGRSVAALGGIHDRSSLALSAGRMKQDPIFRDAAHHFLRKFDRLFSAVAEGLTDAELSLLADTRSARAFMLLGRVTGTFD